MHVVEVLIIFHSKCLVLVRKGRAFYVTLYLEVFFFKSRGGWVLKSNPVAIDIPAALCECSSHIQQSMWYAV